MTTLTWPLGSADVCTSSIDRNSSLEMSTGVVGCGWAVLGAKPTLDEPVLWAAAAGGALSSAVGAQQISH